MHILLIDDDSIRTHPLVHYIKNVTEWEIDWAKSPAEALEKISDNSVNYNAVLLDVMMPPDESIDRLEGDMGFGSGLALLPRLSSMLAADVPVIVYSTRQDLDFLNDDERVAAYIIKPVSPQDVADKIRELTA